MDKTIIIMGATGDLTKKKLIPSIYNLILNGKLDKFALIGVSFEDVKYNSLLNKSKKFIKNIDSKIWKKLENSFYYYKSDFYDEKKLCGLGNFVRNVEKEKGLKCERIFYLATLPQHFKVIAKNLNKCGLAKKSRVVFEKPFGRDLKSAKKINKCIKDVFTEKQIYRIDHYLGKELVQNISVVRFTNTLFEPLWHRKYIDHVQITLSENFGVEERAAFYDKYGALKDVVQNHMMQLVALKPPLKDLIPIQNRRTLITRALVMVAKRNRLVLESKPEERFMLFDSISGLCTTIKVFYRNNGNLAIAFEAPKEVRISREQQRSVKDGVKKRH